jgi:hypothetical protein
MAVNKALEKLLTAAGIPASTPRYVATQESTWLQQGGTLFFNAELEDGARNTVEAYGTLDASNGFVYLALYRFGTGALLADAVVTPAAGMKADCASMWLRQDNQGPYVRLRFGNHQSGPGQPEGLSRDIFDWRPAGLMAIPDGAPREGRYGGYPASAGGINDVTPEQIQAALRVVLGIPANTNINLASLIQGVTDNIKPKTSAAISESQVLRTGSSDAEKFSILRGNSRDGAYEAVVSYFGPKKSASDVVNAAQAVPENLAEKGKQVQAQEAWNKYPKGQAIGTEGEQPEKEGEQKDA